MTKRLIATLGTMVVLALALAPLAGANHPYGDSQAPDRCFNRNEDIPSPTDPGGEGGYDCSPAIWTDCLTGGVCKVCQHYEYQYDHGPETPPFSGFYPSNDSRYYSNCRTV